VTDHETDSVMIPNGPAQSNALVQRLILPSPRLRAYIASHASSISYKEGDDQTEKKREYGNETCLEARGTARKSHS
jgi:hypothetical protein